MENHYSEKRNFNYDMDDVEMTIRSDFFAPHPSVPFKIYLEKAHLDDNASKIAKILGISRCSYYDFINEKTGISPEMSCKLARFFYDFSSEYDEAKSPKFWWDLNSEWLFKTGLKDNNGFDKKVKVGAFRFVQTPEERFDLKKEELYLSQGLKLPLGIELTFSPLTLS